MCIHLYLHRTSPEHDTRFYSILNPATGYKVLSPFQDPRTEHCKYPCLSEERGRLKPCFWHGGCCRFDEESLCQYSSRPQYFCNTWVSFHVFLPANATFSGANLLKAYQAEDPAFLPHAARFFKAGVEFNLALTKLPEIQLALDASHGPGRSDQSKAVQSAGLATRWYHYQHIKLMSAAFLAHLAIEWDKKSQQRRWPLRPGREAAPELNIFNPSDVYLSVAITGTEDCDPRGQWPGFLQQQQLDPGASLAPDPTPNVVPWQFDPGLGSYRAFTDVPWAFGMAVGPCTQASCMGERAERRSKGWSGQNRSRRLQHRAALTGSSRPVSSPLLSPWRFRKRRQSSRLVPGPSKSCLKLLSSDDHTYKRVTFEDEQ